MGMKNAMARLNGHQTGEAGRCVRRLRLAAVIVAVGLGATGCGPNSNSSKSSNSPKSATDGVSVGNGGPDELFAETASFEVIAGKPQRIMVGLSTSDGRILHGGSVEMVFRLADDPASVPEIIATARFLPLPGSVPTGDRAKIGRPSQGIGVYAAHDVTLPKAGLWTIDVFKPGAKATRMAQSAVDAVAEARVPDVGQSVPATDNPTDKSSVPREVLDSRSGPQGMGDELADPVLHRDVINNLLKDRRPFVVVISTPVYCQSRFCGPVTDLIDAIANETSSDHGDVAFVHLEVYEKFDNAAGTRLNPWVVQWIDGSGDGHEPWVFVVDRNGRVAARYDNVIDESELRTAIKRVASR